METIELRALCNGDINVPLIIDVANYESSGKHIRIGRIETTVNEMVSKQNQSGSTWVK